MSSPQPSSPTPFNRAQQFHTLEPRRCLFWLPEWPILADPGLHNGRYPLTLPDACQ